MCTPKANTYCLSALPALSHSFQSAIVDFEACLIPSASSKMALAINTKLRKYIQDMYAKTNKVGSSPHLCMKGVSTV